MSHYSSSQVIIVQRQALGGYGSAAGFAALHLADSYVTPTAPQYDSFRAARWYAYAISRGNISAAFSLGQMYLVGQGVPQDPERGYGLIGWASQYGDPEARSYLTQNPSHAPPTAAFEASSGTSLRPIPPLPPSPPADNSQSDGSDVIGGLALLAAGAVGVAAVASLLGSADTPSPAAPASSGHVSVDACMEVNLGKVFNYEVKGVEATVKGCLN